MLNQKQILIISGDVSFVLEGMTCLIFILRGIELSNRTLIDNTISGYIAKILWIDANKDNPEYIRYYLGKYKVIVLERILNKSYVVFLEKGIVGNQKIGYREAFYYEHIFLYTRNCYRNKRD